MKALKPWQAWLAAAVAIWVVVFAWPAGAPQTEALVHPRERWSLPELPALRDLSAQAQTVGTSPLWGVAPTAPGVTAGGAAAPQEDNRWVLAGIYSRDLDKRVVVRYLAKRGELLLKAGDALPSGEKIVEIGADSVWVKAGTKKRKLPLYSVELIDAVKTAAGADSNPVSANEANPPSPPRRHHP